MRLVFVIALLVIAGCAPPARQMSFVTAVPTFEDAPSIWCAQVARLTGRDWPAVLSALRQLTERGLACDGVPARNLLYAALIAYGDESTRAGAHATAQGAYAEALMLDPASAEALAGLGDLTHEAATVCQEVELASGAYLPSRGTFAQLTPTGFRVDGQAWPLYGIQYAPRDAPLAWWQVTDEIIRAEMGLIHAARLNIVRITIDHRDLFRCEAGIWRGVTERFERLDRLIALTAEQGLRLVFVLSTGAVPAGYYDDINSAQLTMGAIVARYADEPAIIAWDVRERGDQDYANAAEREHVLRWLAEVLAHLRSLTRDQVFTAGWWQDSVVTAPLVDFVSLQYYGDYAPIRQVFADVLARTRKPVWLASIGYSTLHLDEIAQRNLLYQILEEAQYHELIGWVVYKAFDHPLDAFCADASLCDLTPTEAHYYGLWNTSYFPKLAVEAIERIIRDDR